ncbi:hypothetical protein SmJEL517_g06295 [Synchytrium microbalum]|uniref:HTH CENPB-type domain-containing protein n=1 Tax=Synchytrium microbalum TaxID=1806994 RepID=A0A507BIW7_9FUNG|nr:uncharacterized protein SmJEL517_g06295 [Synchytrium microbalum]TPX30017.1 hypothetical protein SmJEL517_g06295 [Synchytrium microbalum]
MGCVRGKVNWAKSQRLFPPRSGNVEEEPVSRGGEGARRGEKSNQEGRVQFNVKEEKDKDKYSSESDEENATDSEYSMASLSSKRKSQPLPLFLVEFDIPREGNKTIQGRAMLDSGANRSLVGYKFLKEHHLKTSPMPRALKLTLGDGKTKLKLTQQTTAVDLKVLGIADRVELPVLHTDGYDIVLGLDLLIRNNPRIDWRNRTINSQPEKEELDAKTTHNTKTLDVPLLGQPTHGMDQYCTYITTPDITIEEQALIPPASWPMSEFPNIFDPLQQQRLPPHRPGWDFDVKFKDNAILPKIARSLDYRSINHHMNRSTLNKWIKKWEASPNVPPKKALRDRPSPVLLVNMALFDWFVLQRERHLAVNGELLKAQALEIRDGVVEILLNHHADKVDQKQINDLTDFVASNGWLDTFKKNYQIKGRTPHGEAGGVDLDLVVNGREELEQILAEFRFEDIYNADETGLFYRLQPDRTMALKDDDSPGTKKSKDRVTVMITTNAAGTSSIPPYVIGQSMKPRCFACIRRDLDSNRFTTLGADYDGQARSWMDTTLMTK